MPPWPAPPPPAPASHGDGLGPLQRLYLAPVLIQAGWTKFTAFENTAAWMGSPDILNNGIEFAATYLVMLVALLFSGRGRYNSADYWIHRAAAR